MKKTVFYIILLTCIHCTKETGSAGEQPLKDSTGVVKNDSLINSAAANKASSSKEEILKKRNDELLRSIKNKNFQEFSTFIHPEKGVRFSMYGYIDPKENKLFTQADFLKFAPTTITFTWGSLDGTGDLYIKPIREYFDEWIFVKDFTKSTYSLDSVQGRGNSLNNIEKIYSGLHFTENYIAGTEKYGQIDWNSLRFVFEEFNSEYYLVAVINDQWTT